MPNVRKKRAQSKRYYIQNRVFADILGIARYFELSLSACSYREPAHFSYLMTNGRCIVAAMKSAALIMQAVLRASSL